MNRIRRSVRRDTIYALASGYGKSAVAIVRVSGPEADQSLRLTKRCGTIVPDLKPRFAHLRTLYDIHAAGQIVDRCLLLRFKAPNSYTGEDMVEFQIHGGMSVKQSLLGCLSNFDGFREALPGEFTKRALINGKLDLLQAEGVNALINAESAADRELCLQQLEGQHSEFYASLRERVLNMLAKVEAYIDFEADETSDARLSGTFKVVLGEAKLLEEEIEGILSGAKRAQIIREGLQVVIVGPPNAGKSTLMNNLAQKDVSIVTSIPGTTRDIVEASVTVGDYQVCLSDTAGIRESSDEVEQIGIERAKARMAQAQALLVVLDITQLAKEGGKFYLNDPQLQAELTDLLPNMHAAILLNKLDQISLDDVPKSIVIGGRTFEAKPISLLTEQPDLSSLLKPVTEVAPTSPLIATNHRHTTLLVDTLTHLQAFQNADLPPDMACEELRSAMNAIAAVTDLADSVDSERVLDRLFAQFCIGK